MANEAVAEGDSSLHATPPTTLGAPPSPPFPSPSTQHKQGGGCFGCGQKGHWVMNCPSKIRRGSSTPGSRNSVPVLRCGCHRTCFVCVSNSEKNPSRKYYRCPECEFIDFCDTFEALMCPCGAGLCTINLEGDGEKRPNFYYTKKQNKRYYYTCLIKRGHGACDFTQFSSGQHPWISQMVPISSEKRKPPLEETPTHHTVSRNQQDSSDGCSLVKVEGRTRVSRLGSQPEIHRRQIAFCNRMSSAGDSPTECKIVYILGVRIFGWLGRLAFPPSPSLADPHFYYIYNHYRSSSIRLSSCAHSVNIVALELISPASPTVDTHSSAIPSSHKRLRSSRQIDPLLEDLMERHMIEKCRFDDICQMYQEALSASTTCDKQLQSLRERSACIKNMLREVEKQLLPCETETEKLKKDVQELSKQLMHSKRKMQVTSRELREAVRDALGRARY